MTISFSPLNESHFPLLLKWLETPHVKKWWDQDVTYTLELVREKYESYVQGYKQIEGVKKPIHGFIIYVDEIPIGYIQIYNAYDFPRARPFLGLPQNLAAFDIFIGEKKSLEQNLGSKILIEFFNLYASQYDYVLATPDSNNIAALKCYEKAGCKRVDSASATGEMWMLRNNTLEELKSREPIFHHPEKFGKTKQAIEAQMCDEFWEVGASGSIYSKQDVIETLLERYNDHDYQDIWEISDFKLTRIAPDNYLLTYNLIQNNTRHTRRSTLWRKVDGQWKILYHQGTVIDE